jgi:hypothetical protein
METQSRPPSHTQGGDRATYQIDEKELGINEDGMLFLDSTP